MIPRLTCASAVCLLLAVACLGQDLPKEVIELNEKADKFIAEKKFTEAAEAMNAAAKLAPKDIRILNKASEVCLAARLFPEGLAHAKAAIALDDRPGLQHVLAAANAFNLQEVADARAYIKTALKSEDKNVHGAAKPIVGLLAKKEYVFEWELDPTKGLAENGVFRVAIPKNDLPYMTCSYKLTGARSHKLLEGESGHLLAIVPDGKNTMKLTVEVSVDLYSYKDKLAARKAGPVPASVQPYLGASEFIKPTSAAIVKVARELKGKDEVETVNNIVAWMNKNVEYKNDGKNAGKLDFENAEQILDRKSGECMGYSILFVALCRSAGVPARQVWGVYVRDADFFASHNWAEVYVGGVGWVPIDPQLPETFGCLPTTHVRYYMGMRKSNKGSESVPQLNLLAMSKDKIKYEVKFSLPEPSGSESPKK